MVLNNNVFYLLREESRKSWEYTITNELMYCFHNFDAIKGSASVCYDQLVTENLRGRWWEILIQDRNGNFYCVIVEPMLDHPRTHIKAKLLPFECKNSMFVTVGEFMQNPERCSNGIYCIVRLTKLDNLSGVIGNVLQESIDFSLGIGVVIQENREGGFPIRGGCGKESQLPDEVIKSRTEVMQNITYDRTNSPRNGFYLNSVDISRLIRIGLSATDEWFSVLPCADEVIERLHVIRRPTDFKVWPIEWVHMLYYPQGDNSGREEEAKDSQRVRNTRTHKRGVRAQSKEGGKDNQITARQPEEVKSQTSHARRSGGCTANNTRLGSLEDA